MVPFETYKCYLSLKRHFVDNKYDYHKYQGKSRASLQSFYKRRDRYFFEKLSRQKNDKEIVEFFVSNFSSSTDPSTLWIGEMIKGGEERYKSWQKRIQSLSYLFRQESEKVFENNFKDVFDCSKGHPVLLRMFLSGEVSIETMVIYDRIFEYVKNFDRKLKDPVWETVRIRIKKYSSFLHIDVFQYKKVLKQIIGGL